MTPYKIITLGLLKEGYTKSNFVENLTVFQFFKKSFKISFFVPSFSKLIRVSTSGYKNCYKSLLLFLDLNLLGSRHFGRHCRRAVSERIWFC